MTPSASTVLILGDGGHARVVAQVGRGNGITVAGFVGVDLSDLDREVGEGGGKVVMLNAQLFALVDDGKPLPLNAHGLLLGVGNNATRWRLRQRIGAYCASALVDASCVVADSVHIGAGTVVFPGAIVNSGARIGDAVIINTRAIVEHDCVIEDGVHISPGAVLTGAVTIGSMSWIGANATILPGVRIGRGTTIGAGSVVLHDVPECVTMVGNPARLLRGVT